MYDLVSEEEDFLVINKHSGASCHRDSHRTGLSTILRDELDLAQVFIVHRLDRITSGLMLVAKNRDAAAEFSALFREKAVEKYYLAISDRQPGKKQGMIRGDMERSRRGTWKLKRTQHNPAVTQFFSLSLGQGLRLFLLKPLTGKTHQLRVALKSMGAPVWGDPLYHDAKGNAESDRPYLHSYAVRFAFRGRVHSLVVPPDRGRCFTAEACIDALAAYENPWELKWPSPRKRR